jgi:hypothetical protein
MFAVEEKKALQGNTWTQGDCLPCSSTFMILEGRLVPPSSIGFRRVSVRFFSRSRVRPSFESAFLNVRFFSSFFLRSVRVLCKCPAGSCAGVSASACFPASLVGSGAELGTDWLWVKLLENAVELVSRHTSVNQANLQKTLGKDRPALQEAHLAEPQTHLHPSHHVNRQY